MLRRGAAVVEAAIMRFHFGACGVILSTATYPTRHPSRAAKISKLISFYNFNFRQKSLSEYPKKNTAVYIADTFGESGTLISISDLIILGGTLVPMGGHNIIESAQMAKCILICIVFYGYVLLVSV